MRRTGFIVASVVVSGLFLWLALRDVPLAEIWANLRGAKPLWVLASIATIFIGLFTRAIRWRGLLDFRVTTWQAYMFLGVTFILNQLPLRAGEVARSLLATRAGVPFMTAATSIVVERLLDTLIVVVMLALALSGLTLDVPGASQLALLFGVAAVTAFAVMIVFARRPAVPHRILNFVERILPVLKRLPLRNLLDHVLDGLKPLTHWKSAAHAIGWTLVSWGWSLGTFFTLEMAFGIGGNHGLTLTALAIALASFSIAIPVSIASIGPWEAAVRLAGEGVELGPTLSLSLGFAFHGVSLFVYAVLGIAGLVSQGVSLGEMLNRTAEAKGDSTTEDTKDTEIRTAENAEKRFKT
jgi:uncharacterized membrane protein YbhN (UPF0104 family)